MNRKRLWSVLSLLFLILLAGACAALPPVTPPPTPWPPLEAVRQALAGQLGLAADAITLVSSESAQWRNGCLELAGPDEMCTMAIVPGYRIVVEAAGQQYVFHTNQSGSHVRMAGAPAPEELPEAALRARAALAQQLSLAPETVRVVSVEAVEWPDACLGIYVADEACAQVVTPGYKVVLEAGGVRYEYHTDATGDVLRPLPVAAEGRLGCSI